MIFSQMVDLRRIIVTVCLLMTAFHGWSQEDVKIKKGKFKTGIDIGFKEAWQSIKQGDRYYKKGVGTYDLARDHYLFAEQYNPDNAALNYKLGVCYAKMNRTEEAEGIFEAIVQNYRDSDVAKDAADRIASMN